MQKSEKELHDTAFANDVETEELEHGRVLYRASFVDRTDQFVAYSTMIFLLISIGLTLVYGVGIFMLLWIPAIRTIARRDMQSRRLYVTTESVVYKRAPPVCCPCFGVNRTEVHVMLPLVTDVVVQQGCMEARYGIHSIAIKNAGGGNVNGGGADVSIQGITAPREFKKVVLWAASVKRSGRSLTKEMVDHILLSDNVDHDDAEAQHGGGAVGGELMPLRRGGNNNNNNQINEEVQVQMKEMNASLREIAELLKLGFGITATKEPVVEEDVVVAITPNDVV